MNKGEEFKDVESDQGGPTSDTAERSMSAVSKRYDHNNKGYLDDTEKALRRMDTQNLGTLSVDKVYTIMESLQTEQKRSAQLMEDIREEHQKAIGLKKGIVALACFTVLLALSNIGTSFAAARLAKDTKVENNILVSRDGTMLATGNKVNEVIMEPLDPSTDGRRLRQLRLSSSICDEDMNGNVTCSVQGKLTKKAASNLYWEFCPNFPLTSTCTGQASQLVLLNCNDVKTTVRPGTTYTSGRKANEQDSRDGLFKETHFPHNGTGGFAGSQDIVEPGQATTCLQPFLFKIVCSTDPFFEGGCLMFATIINRCGVTTTLCGDPDAVVVL